MFKSVREIMMFVPNVPRARDWYREFLEFGPIIDTKEYCQFKIGDGELGLHPEDDKMQAGQNGTVAYFEVDDIDITLARAQALGAVLYRGPKTIHGDRVICQLLDPFGNVLGLTQILGN